MRNREDMYPIQPFFHVFVDACLSFKLSFLKILNAHATHFLYRYLLHLAGFIVRRFVFSFSFAFRSYTVV
jgi:hypothetical protein